MKYSNLIKRKVKEMKLYLMKIRLLMAYLMLSSIIVSCSSSAENQKQDPNQGITSAADQKPMIIWYHNCGSFSLKSLETALESKLIDTVLIFYMHRDDGLWNEKAYVTRAIQIAKKARVKIIWGRSLWPWYNIRNSKPQDLFSPEYYIRQILSVRAEAKEIGADFVAFDAEAYAKSPMKQYLRSRNRLLLDEQQRQQLKQVVRQATDAVGQVDFILPAGSVSTIHPYNFLANLGKRRISEHTYYDNLKFIKNIRYPYEIFGAFISTSKKNKSRPEAPYFLAGEIFKKSYLWSRKKGLLLYTYRNSLEVAQDLLHYSRLQHTIPFSSKPK